MNKSDFKENSLVFIIIFLSVTPLLKIEVISISMLIITFILFIKNRKSNISKDEIKKISPFIILSILTIIIDAINESNNKINLFSLYIPLVFIFGIYVNKTINKNTNNNFLDIFEKIIMYITIFSLGSVIIYTFLPNLITYLPTYNNRGTIHKTLFVFNILISEGKPLKRNTGIAWEPGVFQLLINVALNIKIMRLNKAEKINKKDILIIIIYIIGVLTTKSTVGIMLLFINIIFMIVKFKNLKIRKKTFIIMLITLLCSIPYIYPYIIKNVINKGFGTISFNIRFKPFIDAVKLSLSNPLGLGNNGFDIYYQTIMPPWDSIGQILVRYGIIFFVFYIFNLYRLKKLNIALFIIIILSLFTQNIWFSPLLITLLFYGENNNYYRKERLK